jgi:hypothetical protein
MIWLWFQLIFCDLAWIFIDLLDLAWIFIVFFLIRHGILWIFLMWFGFALILHGFPLIFANPNHIKKIQRIPCRIKKKTMKIHARSSKSMKIHAKSQKIN